MTLSSPRRPRGPETPPYQEDSTAATRHLCAAAYLHDEFREISLRHVYYQPRRVVAPSYGFDLVPVLAHCLKARNGAIARDAAIVVTFLVTACVSWMAILSVLSTMIYLQVVVASYRLFRDTFHRLRGVATENQASLVPRAIMLALGWVFALSFGWFGTALMVAQSTGAFVGGGLEGGVDQAVGDAMLVLVGSLLLTLLIFAYPVGFSLWRQNELTHLAPGSRITVPARSARLDEIAQQQRGNTVVYSGFQPFVGSGAIVGRWGLALRLLRPQPSTAEVLNGAGGARSAVTERQREFPEPPFEAQDLIEFVSRDLSVLLPERAAEEQIAGLTVEGRVHLAGTEVSRLSTYSDPALMAGVIRHPTTPARHYLACQIFSWGGELITTVYVHIAVQGRSLYLELSTTALPPCLSEYRIVDSVEGTGAFAWLRAVRTGLVDTPATIWRAPLSLTRALINLIAGSGGGVGTANRLAKGYDYGARLSVREIASESFRNLVQISDVEKYQRLIERRVIASVLDFLDERGIDTTEYRRRAVPGIQVGTLNGNLNSVGPNANFHDKVDMRSGSDS